MKVTPKSYLLVDCGTANTTAILIDVVEGRYRLIGQAAEPSTALAPWNDAFSGIQQVINQLMEMTGRRLLTAEGDLIHPADANGAGVDIFGLTFSAAPALKTVLVGLLEEVSLGSGRRALNTIYAEEIEQLSLTDSREEKEQIDALLAQLPDLVLMTGGTDGGADDRLIRLV
ncbi:MAG: glutamate mutase L, partial [Anaerolineales bacterium]|nr:glutamate mutase L [Anaerolineales bacterium]